jgi:hypothetical protein
VLQGIAPTMLKNQPREEALKFRTSSVPLTVDAR